MTSCVLLLLSALTITLQVHDVTSWSFNNTSFPLVATVYPRETRHDSFYLSVTMMCQADTPLDKCHVNMYNKDNSNHFVDLSRGANSAVITSYHEKFEDLFVYNVSYFGTGLENGQCGAIYFFSALAETPFHFGCRGANAAGEWQDMDHVFHFWSVEPLPASITPLRAIAQPGSNVSVVLHSSKPMLFCLMGQNIHSEQTLLFTKDGTTLWHSSDPSPSLDDCGTTLLNVTEENNGPYTILGFLNMDHVAQLVSSVIVATPPAEVFFKLDKLIYSVEDTLNAKCSSHLSRPVANLTWTLDDKVIRQDANRDVGGDAWSWSWDKQNITQILSLKLGEEDFGKKLECRVEHLGTVYSKSSFINRESFNSIQKESVTKSNSQNL